MPSRRLAARLQWHFIPAEGWDAISRMGKLNIAHHKSYHPYRRDNIERVRRDEEEARQKEAIEEGRMMLAVRSQCIRSV